MNLLCFDKREKRLPDCSHVVSCKVKQNYEENICTLRAYMLHPLTHYIAFKDSNNKLKLYELKERKEDEITGEVIAYCESSYYELGVEGILENFTRENTTVNEIVSSLLHGTRWKLGNSVSLLVPQFEIHFANPLQALSLLAKTAGIYFEDRIEYNATGIVHRYFDVYSIAANYFRGKRYEIGKDILQAHFIEDKRNLITALFPLGKEIGDKDNKEKLTLKGYEAAGLKPGYEKITEKGYIENTIATAAYGILEQKPRFAIKQYQSESQEELFRLAQDDLEKASTPVLHGTVSAVDLERLGFAHEAVRINDEVAFVCGKHRYYANIISIEREYAELGRDNISFGQAKDSMQKAVYKAIQIAESAKEIAESENALALLPDGLLDGYIDTAKTRILSSQTNRVTDTDGGDMYITADGSKAIKLTGAGILCADNKIGGNWQWRTAIEGSGVVTQMLTAGIIQAALVRIVGSEHFLWDAENIIIKNPANTNEMIRIGRYNGSAYGIGFTKNGGISWLNAMDFEGIKANIQGNGITIDQNGIEMTGKKLNVQAGNYGDVNYFELNALLGWMRTGFWTFDSQGARFSQGGEGFSLTKYMSMARLTSNNLHLTVGADLQHGLDLTGSHIQFTIDSLNTSITMGKVVNGYTYNDICFVCTEAGDTWDTAVGNLGTTSNRWDILWCDTIHYRTLNNNSSRKVKNYIKPLKEVGEALDKLQPVSFVYKGDSRSKRQYGLIFEDTVDILPDICIPAETEQDVDGIDYTKLIPLLLKEVQSLRNRVAELEKTHG